MATDKVSLYAVGDVGAFFKNPESMFVHTSSVLNEADITFAQNERHYSDHYTEEHDLVPGAPITEVCPSKHAAALKLGGFDVLSFASNHSMDMGGKAMLETIITLKDNGFAVIGAGKNIEEARKPAIFERNGTKVAYLAYCSVLRSGYEAGPDKPGCAPLRASTFYEQVDYQPGTPPVIISIANRDDLEAMKEDIRKAKLVADVVVISMHWGIHYISAILAMYQREIAHEAIDVGADLIVGHHPHLLKGIEVYKGKAIFYSMGNFAFDLPQSVRTARQNMKSKKLAGDLTRLGLGGHVKVDPEYAEVYAWPAESRKSMIVKCLISNKKIEKVSFLPVLVNTKAQPVVVSREEDFQEALKHIKEISHSQGLDTKFLTDKSEIIIAT